MIFADIIALIGMVFSIMMFLYLGAQSATRKITLEAVLLANRSAKPMQFGASFAAASTSLATVLIFFISTSSFFGLSLLWCGATYFIGQVIFIKLMKAINIETSNLTTNADFILNHTGSQKTAKAIAVLTASAFILILFLELYIGSEIISYYLYNLGPLGKAIAFFTLGAIVIFYVRLGGLTVVFRTDTWQLALMVVACIALLVFSLVHSPAASGSFQPTKPILFANATKFQLVVFVLWILILNFTLPFTQLSSWQRLAATKSVDHAWKGLKATTPSFLVIWMLPVVALVILNAKGVNAVSLTGLFDTLKSGNTEYINIIYPIIFVGFASALFSTADTAIVALQFSLADNATFGSKLKQIEERSLGRTLTLSMLGIVIVLAVIYGLAEADLGELFIPLVYTIFSQLSIIAPQVIYAMLEASGKIPARELTSSSDRINTAGLLVAWIVLVGATIGKVKNFLPVANTQEVATYIAVAISALVQVLAYVVAKAQSQFLRGGQYGT